jgi:hypothetical protein
MVKARDLLATIALIAGAACAAAGQVAAAGAAGGYGKVYEAAGKAPATRGLQQGMGATLQRAVQKSRSATGRSGTSKPGRVQMRSTSPVPARSTQPAPQSSPESNYAFFKPDPGVDTFGLMADSLSSNTNERALLRSMFSETKKAFESEVAAKGRSNNLAAAYTFFVAASTMVYHNDPEPSDQEIDQLWDGMNSVFNETPEFASIPDADKQQLYDMLIAFSGLLLVGHLEARNNGDGATVQTFKQLSGVLIQTILKTDPEKLRFKNGGLNIGQ